MHHRICVRCVPQVRIQGIEFAAAVQAEVGAAFALKASDECAANGGVKLYGGVGIGVHLPPIDAKAMFNSAYVASARTVLSESRFWDVAHMSAARAHRGTQVHDCAPGFFATALGGTGGVDLEHCRAPPSA